MAAKVGSVTVDLLLNTAKFEKEINKASRKFTTMGRDLSRTGKSMTQGLTVPLVAAGAAVTKFAVDFNKSMANVATLIPGNLERVQELKGGVQDLAITTGKSTEDMADGLYQVVSAFGDLGQSKPGETMKILELNAYAATAGVATVTDAINLTSAVTKGYGEVSAEATKKASDLAFMTVKLGQTTFPELASSIQATIPIAKQMNVSQEELFASMATLTGVTGNASEVSTQMASVLTGMIKPSKEMTEAVQALGYSTSSAMVQELGLQGALQALIGTTDGSNEAVGKLLGRKEALTAAFALTGAQAETFTQRLDDMANSAGATDEAFKEQTEGINKFGFQIEQMKQRFVVAAQKLGDALIPVLSKSLGFFEKLAEGAAKLAEWFTKLPSGVQSTVVAILGVVAAAGPLLMMFGHMNTAIGNGIKLFGKFSGPISKVTQYIVKAGGLLPALKGLVAVLTGPVGIAVGIGAAVAALVVWGSKNEKVVAFVKKAWGGIKEFFSGLWNWIKSAAEELIGRLRDVWLKHKDQFVEAWNNLKDAAVGVWNAIKEKASEIWDGIKDVVQGVVDGITAVWEKWGPAVLTVIDGVWTNITSSFQMAFDILASVVGGALDVLSGIFNVFAGVFTLNWDTFSKGIGQIWEGLWTAVKGVFQAGADHIVRMINWTIEQVNKLLPEKWEIPTIEIDLDTKPFDDANKNIQDNVKRTTEETKKVVPVTKDFAQELNNLDPKANKAAGSVKKLADAESDLIKEFRASLRPFGDLEKEIKELTDAGEDGHKVIKIYADKIIKAKEECDRLGIALTDNQRKLYQWAREATRAYTIADLLGGGFADLTIKGNLSERQLDDLNRTLPETAGLLDEANQSVLDIAGVFGDLGSATEDTAERGKSSMNSLGQAVSTTLTNMTQDLFSKVKTWAGPFGDFAAAALSSLTEGLLNPFMSMLTQIGNNIGNWLSGLIFGKKGEGGIFSGLGDLFGGGEDGGGLFSGLGDLFGGGGEGEGGLFSGLGGKIKGGLGAVGGAISTAISSIGSGITAGLGAVGGALSSAMGAIWSGLAAAGPAGWIGAIGAGSYFGIKALIGAFSGPNSYEALTKEIARDYGGVNVPEEVIKAFLDAVGISEPEAWDIRKNISSSPAFLLGVVGKFAEEQGKVNEFLKSLENLQTSWGTFDFRAPFETGLETGDWTKLNEMWESISKIGTGDITTAADNFADLLLPSVESAAAEAANAATATEELALKNKELEQESQKAADALANLNKELEKAGINAQTLANAFNLSPALIAQMQTVLGSGQHGIPNVPREGLYWLHPEERVLTKEQNRTFNYRQGPVNLSFRIAGGSADEMEQVFRQRIIPLIVSEVKGGPTELREAIRFSLSKTQGAY